jgi:DNA-binding response OmpR family regulator
MMPVLSGWEVLRILRNARPTLPVVVLSAAGVKEGIDYIPKPVSFQKLETLLDIIRARLAERTARTA